MASKLAERFMDALQDAENRDAVEPLMPLFGEEAELTRLTHEEPHRGTEGARAFWQEYLEQFAQIHSTFHNVIEGKEGIALEWSSKGNLPSGEPFEYDGVSILEGRNGQIYRFRTYYDSAAFLTQHAGE